MWYLTPKRKHEMQLVEQVKTPVLQLVDEIYAPMLSDKSEKVKEQEAKISSLKKNQFYSRYIEASCDCV
jgi:uncharacterized protein (DUF2461 family)